MTKETQKDESIMQPHRIYLKSSGFERNSLTMVALKEKPIPEISMQVHRGVEEQARDLYNVMITLQLTAQHNNDQVWRIQVQQAGLFTVKGFSEEVCQRLLNDLCMNMIFPYACEAVADLAVRGGLEPIYLAPIDFGRLYEEQQEPTHSDGAAS